MSRVRKGTAVSNHLNLLAALLPRFWLSDCLSLAWRGSGGEAGQANGEADSGLHRRP